MSIKGLFNHNEKNDEMNKLIKRVKTLEMKTNSLDVYMKRLAKFENEWRTGTFSTKQSTVDKEVSRKTDKMLALKREETTALQKRLYSQLSRYILQLLGPIQQEIDQLAERTAALEENFSLTEKLLLENQQQIIQCKEEIDKLKKKDKPTTTGDKHVIIRELKVDKIMLDRYEQNNNIASLGIKELGGELNIGTTYGKGSIPGELVDQLTDDLQNLVTEEKQESQNAFNSESSDSPNNLHEETDKEHYTSEQSTPFSNQQQDDEDDTDGFIEVPIE